jgi:hypothetical protein
MNESMSDFREITKEEYNDYEELWMVTLLSLMRVG